ncbi:MAG: M15 family metallopeptidase [Sporichthyaceae bacterium]
MTVRRRRLRCGLALLAGALLVAGCGTDSAAPVAAVNPGPLAGEPAPASPTPAATPSAPPTQAPTDPGAAGADPVIRPIPAAQWERMVEVGMWRPGCPATRSDLRVVEVNHVDFDGEIQRGNLVVNKDVATSISRLFTRFFDEGFPIARMQSVEAYNGDSNASLRDNNTAAYNCRRPDQINAPPTASPHANGRAIDINPLKNPWMDLRCQCWSPSAKFKERVPGQGTILKGGLVWKAFLNEGWIWQNIDVPDYMHFDTGYPSAPFTPAS